MFCPYALLMSRKVNCLGPAEPDSKTCLCKLAIMLCCITPKTTSSTLPKTLRGLDLVNIRGLYIFSDRSHGLFSLVDVFLQLQEPVGKWDRNLAKRAQGLEVSGMWGSVAQDDLLTTSAASITMSVPSLWLKCRNLHSQNITFGWEKGDRSRLTLEETASRFCCCF